MDHSERTAAVDVSVRTTLPSGRIVTQERLSDRDGVLLSFSLTHGLQCYTKVDRRTVNATDELKTYRWDYECSWCTLRRSRKSRQAILCS